MDDATIPTLVYLEWADAFTHKGWFTQDEATDWIKSAEWVVRECGWLLQENDEFIVFAGAWAPETSYSDEQFLNLHKIPKTWIRKRKTIKI